MADSREFVLIGSFTDRITPSLDRINTSIATLKTNLANLSNATKPLKSDFKELASLSKDFNSSLKTQATDIKQMTTALKAFRSEMGRVNRSYRAGGNRMMRQAAGSPPPRPPSPPVPGGGGGRSGRGGYGGGNGFAAAAGGAVAGNQIANTLTSAIVSGFTMGVSIMEKPFRYFTSALGERIRDEMSDIKAAGGYFSIAKRQEQPFVKTFDQALEFTQKNNAVLAKLAASLPGSTQDYIEVSKRIGDSVARTVMTDKGAAVAYANELRRQFPTMYGGQLQGQGLQAQQGAITTLLGELTKKTVLAGQGGRSGAGGAIGPYGLPGLTERMLSQQEVSMGQFQRYSAIFSDPMIMDALQREIPKINATAMNSIDRFKALQKFYDDVLPPEMIEKYRRSIAGLQESFNTAIMGPETGLFGLGRKMQGLGRKINDYGQYVDELGNIVTDVNNAAKVDLSVFDLLRDVLANTAQVLMPIIDNITLIYDPLKAIGFSLTDARHYTAEFLKSFNQYKEGMEVYAKTLSKAMGGKLLETKDLRASFAAISNLFKQLGVFNDEEFKNVSKQILDPNANLGQILKGLLDTFLNSKAATQIGEFIGTLLGTVLSEIAKAMGFVTGLATGGPLAAGLMKGFESAGGSAAFASIIQNTFALLGKLLLDIVKAAPLQTAVLGALMLLPAAISGLITAAITAGTIRAAAMIKARGGVGGLAASAKPLLSAQASNTAKAGMMMPGVKGAAALATKGKMAGIGLAAAGIVKLATVSPKLAEVGKGAMKLAKAAPGLSLLFAGADVALGKMSGESTAEAVSGATGGLVGGMVGAAIGTGILPGVGTAIGSILGTFLGDWIGSNLPRFFAGLPGQLDAAWQTLQGWFSNLPYKLGFALGQAKVGLESAWSGFTTWWNSLGPWWSTILVRTLSTLRGAWGRFTNGIKTLFSEGINFSSLIPMLGNALKGMVTGAIGWVAGAAGQFTQGARAGEVSARSKAKPSYGGSLGSAISSEMRNKPSNSDLVIANSSETVIPAAGGLGMQAFMDLLSRGFSTINQQYVSVANGLNTTRTDMQKSFQQSETKNNDRYNATNERINKFQEQTNKHLTGIDQNIASLGQKMATMSAMGGMGGAGGMDLGGGYGGGGVAIAGQLGNYMKSTGGAPGSIWEHPMHGGVKGRHAPGSYHYSGRAIDIGAYANEQAGVIARIKEFNAKMGVKPVEFLHAGNDPNHQDHVHVAYATGMPTMFSNRKDALNWENRATMGNVKVSSITARQGEFGGSSPITINAPITITQQAGQSADELASIVALKIGEAVADARAASVFV